jgi:hypothetical protein
MRDVIFRCRRHIGRRFGAAGAGLPFNPYRGRTVATIAAMGFDPEEARRRIMPAHDAKVARYRAVMDALESAIDRAHQEITRRDYAHGGTIAIWGDAGTPNIQRVAWQFGEIASSSDGTPVWTQFFIDEKGDIEVDTWCNSAGPVAPDNKLVRRVYERGGGGTGNDAVAPRYTYPTLLLALLDDFTRGARVGTIDYAAEGRLWNDYGSSMRSS